MYFDTTIDDHWAKKIIDEPDGHDSPDQESDSLSSITNKCQIEHAGNDNKSRTNAWNECSDRGDRTPQRRTWHAEDGKADTGQDTLNDTNSDTARKNRVDSLFKHPEDLFVIIVTERRESNDL